MTFHLRRLFAIRFPRFMKSLFANYEQPKKQRCRDQYTKKGLAGYCERVFVNKRTVKC